VKITELHELGAAFDEMVRRRRLVEETLEEAHKQAVWLARLPDENPSPMLRASSDGTVLYRNPASSRLEGWSCRVGSPVCGPLLALVAQAMGEGHEVQSDQHFGEKSYAVSVMPFPREGYANVYGRDITERLAVEEHLRHAVADLGRSNRDLEQFAYIASHDLQEPLRMITGYLELLEQGYKDKLDEEARTFIGFAVDGARRMQRLVRDLLAYSRLATRGQPLQPAPIQEAYDAAVANLAAVIRDSGAEVMHDDLPVVWADQTQMTVLFQNLLSNALKFHSEERPPRIHVGVQHQDGQWCFAISDNGIGLEPRHADRIFLIFQRLHPRERYPGSGIGLAICKRIVERHGGRIWVESQPGRGATFYFTLPAKEPAGALPPTRIAG
jgi:signal transduction histidine kinase